MNETRLLELIDAYGADPERWPAGERPAALALLARSAAARTALAEASALDHLLDAAPAPVAPTADLAARVLARAPRAAVRVRRPLRRFVATALPVAAAAGFLLWMAGPTTDMPAPGPSAIGEVAALGDLTVPTDVLLDLSDLTLADDPDLSCDESAFGCLDFDLDDEQPRAQRAGEASV
jgi:hypothetical protein